MYFRKCEFLKNQAGLESNFYSILALIFDPFELDTSYKAHSTRIFEPRRLRPCRTRSEQPFDLEVKNTDPNFYFPALPKQKSLSKTRIQNLCLCLTVNCALKYEIDRLL